MKTKDQNNDKSRDERLEELAEALKEAQMMLLKQSELLEQCTSSFAEPEHSLAEARQELALVTAERDKLQKQLLSLEKMQTETVALPEGHPVISDSQDKLPSIQELMADLFSSTEDSGDHEAPRYRLNGPSAEAPESELGELIAPEVIAPEVFEGEDDEEDEHPSSPTASPSGTPSATPTVAATGTPAASATSVASGETTQSIPANAGSYSLPARDAGAVAFSFQGETLTVAGVTTAAGWSATVEEAAGSEIRVRFSSGRFGRRIWLE